jgi:hypothetical protein
MASMTGAATETGSLLYWLYRGSACAEEPSGVGAFCPKETIRLRSIAQVVRETSTCSGDSRLAQTDPRGDAPLEKGVSAFW